jgi:hypothetical protein
VRHASGDFRKSAGQQQIDQLALTAYSQQELPAQ